MVSQGGVELRGSAHARQRHVASVFCEKETPRRERSSRLLAEVKAVQNELMYAIAVHDQHLSYARSWKCQRD